jgi:hypothetical protein
MNQLPSNYPMVHIYPQKKVREQVVIKGNVEGLCSLINALISAIAYTEIPGIAQVFCNDAEVYELVVNLVTTHDELSPLPYQNHEVI